MTNSSVKQWFRFSVRKLLVLVAASAVILACYSQLTLGYRQSRMSANIIRAAGGSVLWSTGSTVDEIFPSVVQVDLRNCKLTDDEYAALAKIPHYFLLIIDSDIFDQDAMRKLAEIEYLSGLSLEPEPVAETAVNDFQEQRPDIIVTVGLFGESSYREYPRPNEERGITKRSTEAADSAFPEINAFWRRLGYRQRYSPRRKKCLEN